MGADGAPYPRFVRVVTRVITRFYWLVLILAIVVSYFSFGIAKQLKLDTNIVSLMPDGVPSVENLDRVIKITGGYSNAMVVVDSSRPDKAIEFLSALRDEVRKLDWVSSAEYVEDTAIFQRHQLLYVDVDDLEEVRRRLGARIDYEKKHLRFEVKDTPVQIDIRDSEATKEPPSLDFSDIEQKYRGKTKNLGKQRVFRNDAGNLTILVILPKGSTTNISYSRRVLQDIQDKIKLVDPVRFDPEMRVQLGGRVKYRVAEFDAIIGDVKSSALWSFSAILLVIVLYYRRLLSLLYVGVPLLMGFVWTFAIVRETLGGLNLITVFLVLILFGLGVDFGIHNLARYDEVRRNRKSVERALLTVYSRTGYASLLAAVTTIVGFFSLMTTNFRAFFEFGFIAGTGVGMTLLAMYVVFPALMVAAERVRVYRVTRRPVVSPAGARGRFPAVAPILTAGLLLSVAAGWALTDLKFEDDFGKLKARIPEIDAIKSSVRDVFPFRSDRAVVFVDSLQEVRELVEVVKRIKDEKPQDSPIEDVKSILSVVPRDEEQKQRLTVIEHIDALLKEAIRLLEDFGSMDDERRTELLRLLEYAGVSELKPHNLPDAIQRLYTGVPGSGGYLVYIYNSKGTSKLEEAQEFVDNIREIEVNGRTYYPATEAMVFVDMLNLMKKDATLAVVAVVVAIVVVLLLVFRSVSQVLIVIVPVAAGTLWMLGLMAAFGLRLNIFNMVVLPTVLGIGIDNGIHIFHRYREEGFGRLRHVVRTTGGAAFLTTLTTMLGFAGMLSASNQGLQSLGLIACLGLGMCMLSSLTVFPALLQLLEDRRLKPQLASGTPAA